ncbi:MAG: VWA domain-containing protein [Bacteroidia bacterium]|nr:VWA domain-containing protein [Bacteroidia bacterium]
MKKLTILICALLCTFQSNGQQNEAPSPIIFIYDASGSMWGQMEGKTKVEIATSVLSTAVNNLPENQKVGLVAYGHRKKGDCKDVQTLVPMSNSSKRTVTSALKNIKPLGRTPLAYSAELVIGDLRSSKNKATVILITDGIESCDGDICKVVAAAKAEGIDFKLHIVGFGLKEGETEQLRCAAKAGDGNYYDASNAGGLGEVLNEVTEQTIDKPAGNVSFYATKNGQPVDAWIQAFDVIAKRKPISVRTYKDTASVFLPPSTYNVEARPLEGSDVGSVTLEGVTSYEDKVVHRTISFDGGTFNITITNNGEGWDSTVKVLDQSGKTIGASRTYGKPVDIEVSPGVYDIEVQALRMKGLETQFIFEDVSLNAGATTTREHDFKTGIANLGVSENGTLIDCTVNIYTKSTEESVAGGRSYTSSSSNPREYILNPGDYKVKLRGRKNGADTIKWFEITVKEGESITKMYEW